MPNLRREFWEKKRMPSVPGVDSRQHFLIYPMVLNTVQKTLNGLIAISEEQQMASFITWPIHICSYAKAKHVHDISSHICNEQ